MKKRKPTLSDKATVISTEVFSMQQVCNIEMMAAIEKGDEFDFKDLKSKTVYYLNVKSRNSFSEFEANIPIDTPEDAPEIKIGEEFDFKKYRLKPRSSDLKSGDADEDILEQLSKIGKFHQRLENSEEDPRYSYETCYFYGNFIFEYSQTYDKHILEYIKLALWVIDLLYEFKFETPSAQLRLVKNKDSERDRHNFYTIGYCLGKISVLSTNTPNIVTGIAMSGGRPKGRKNAKTVLNDQRFDRVESVREFVKLEKLTAHAISNRSALARDIESVTKQLIKQRAEHVNESNMEFIIVRDENRRPVCKESALELETLIQSDGTSIDSQAISKYLKELFPKPK